MTEDRARARSARMTALGGPALAIFAALTRELAKARELGVTVLSEDEWLALVGA